MEPKPVPNPIYDLIALILFSVAFCAAGLWVVPQFKAIFAQMGGTLPIFTEFITGYYIPLFIGIPILVITLGIRGFRRWENVKANRLFFHLFWPMLLIILFSFLALMGPFGGPFGSRSM